MHAHTHTHTQTQTHTHANTHTQTHTPRHTVSRACLKCYPASSRQYEGINHLKITCTYLLYNVAFSQGPCSSAASKKSVWIFFPLSLSLFLSLNHFFALFFAFPSSEQDCQPDINSCYYMEGNSKPGFSRGRRRCWHGNQVSSEHCSHWWLGHCDITALKDAGFTARLTETGSVCAPNKHLMFPTLTPRSLRATPSKYISAHTSTVQREYLNRFKQPFGS